ncbi:MAG: hypothetical protein V1900_00225 [Candidatus Aenigmatarchaeota archaeon]
MSLTKIEEKLLRKIGESSLVTKNELKKIIKDDGNAGKDLNVIIDSATRGLIEKNLVTTINPIGSTCYIITKNGSRALQDMER